MQIGSKHGTPVTVHIADTESGVLVTTSRDHDWLDRVADVSEMAERAATCPISLLAMVPDVIEGLRQENIAPQTWDAINDFCALTRSLAGEKNAPAHPKICEYCGTANDPELEQCPACGAALLVDLPRICPKCGRAHTSGALFCRRAEPDWSQVDATERVVLRRFVVKAIVRKVPIRYNQIDIAE